MVNMFFRITLVALNKKYNKYCSVSVKMLLAVLYV
jgi:hypothetical protein